MADSDLDKAEFAIAVRVLERIADDRTLLGTFNSDERKALLRAAGIVAGPEAKAKRKLSKALRLKDKVAKRTHDEELRVGTGIRKLRFEPVFVTPGPELIGSQNDDDDRRLLVDGRDRFDGGAKEGAADGAGANENNVVDVDGAPRLVSPRMCYACKTDYTEVHGFYDQMCRACGDLNFRKRAPKHDLSGRVALMTGGRVKIGYHAVILLLRNGCHVVVTTRFPRDAAARYAREPDFAQWSHRLEIFGIDLRHTPSVERLAAHLSSTLPALDFIIHNACQTVRRPPEYYTHLLEGEDRALDALPKSERKVLASYEQLLREDEKESHDKKLLAPAPLSQIRVDDDDHALLLAGRETVGELFPTGLLDADLQQVDLREKNSWRLRHHEVSTTELLEVLLVNAVGPFVLSARLKPLMLRTTTRDKHIVNVSAMEGQFHRNKTDKHPHTNMAKAALNMLTRTSAQDYVRDGIHMNSVDTGWITDEDPAHITKQKEDMHRFSPPLDVVDGAARIVDPIFVGLETGQHPWGQFFKDYVATHW